MGRSLDPKCKQCRRVDEKLFLKGERCNSLRCALLKRKYPPGAHGPKQRIRLSEYGLQLREKQKAKRTYRILESQFADYAKRAMHLSGDVGYNLLRLLEHRLDNVLYRSRVACSRDQARQLVSHGKVKVNDKKVDIPSYSVKVGDIITFDDKDFLVRQFKESGGQDEKSPESVPSWISLDPKAMNLNILSELDPVDLPQNIDTRLIIEYYSR